MKKVVYSFCFSFFLITLQSCEKDVEVKLPEVETKLVLSSFICPQDERTLVSVSLSQPLYNTPKNGGSYQPIPNATVVISSGSSSWTLPYDATIGRYAIDSFQLKVKPGATYHLSVSTPDGKFAEAVTTIPVLNNSLTYTATENTAQTDSYIFHAAWQDLPNSTDYYEVELYPQISDMYRIYEQVADTRNPGGMLKSNLNFPYDPAMNDTVFATLSNISVEYYNYYQRLEKVQNSGGPFSEPIAMYTNINGGFGVFAGFNTYTVRVFPL